MELLGKLTDAGSMFWQSLDGRERLLMLYVGAAFLFLSYLTAKQQADAERERRLLERLRSELPSAH